MIERTKFFGIARDDFLDASHWTNVIIEGSLDPVDGFFELYLCTPIVIVRLRAHEMGASRWEYFVLECKVVNEIVRVRQELEVEVLGKMWPVAEPRFSILAALDAFTGIRLVSHSVEVSKSETHDAEDELEITHPGGVYRVGINVVGCLTFRSEPSSRSSIGDR